MSSVLVKFIVKERGCVTAVIAWCQFDSIYRIFEWFPEENEYRAEFTIKPENYKKVLNSFQAYSGLEVSLVEKEVDLKDYIKINHSEIIH